MSLRYLDINPTPISEDEIYGIDKLTADSVTASVKYLLNKVEQYQGDELINTTSVEVFSDGFYSIGTASLSTFYNSRLKKYYNLQFGGEKSYDIETPIFFFQAFNFGGVDEGSMEIVLQYINAFSKFIMFNQELGYIYIGKKDNKICKMVLNDTPVFSEYNGEKIKDVIDTDIFYVFDMSAMSSDLKGENVIFKIGKYLYRYNVYDDFIDDNIILWGILPEEISNLSLNIDINQTGFSINGFFLTDVDNHKYYSALLTDTPPTPVPTPTSYTIRFLNYDGSVLETKEVEEGTTPAYTGQTPTREGYTFIGWTPTLYPADKNQDYTAEFKQNARNITLTLKTSNDDIIKTGVYENVENPITKIVINSVTTCDVTIIQSDNASYRIYPSSQFLPYIKSYTYKGTTYNATFNSLEDTEIVTNDTSEEITIIFNVDETYRYLINFYGDTTPLRTIYQSLRVENGVTPTYSGVTPTKEGYTFNGWTPALYPADKNQDYNAIFEITKVPYAIALEDSNNEPFTSSPTSIIFNNQLTRILFNNDLFGNPYIYYVDIDGEHTINLTYTNKGGFTRITLGSIEINGETYSDLNTWFDLNISNAITITLNSVVSYYIQFKDDDEFNLYSYRCLKGSTPVYGGSTPSKTGYDFIGWTPTLYPADKEQVYTATYQIKTFTIRFLNDDGSVLESKSVNYGETPTYTGTTPTKEGYTFNGWSPTLYPANKNQDYTATFRNSAFALTLYKNTAENNRIDKTDYLTSVGEITGYLRKETNIINPSIVIEYTGVIDFNYVYISTFNRYYFVNNITSVRTNLWRLDMSCDVLMTYKETILNYECYVSRNENDYNEDIEDKYLPLEYEKVVDYILQQDTTGTNPDFFKGFSALITTLATSPEVNLESENIEITTPFNDLDGELAKTNIYEAGSSNFKVVQMITDVGAYADCMNTIANALIQDDTKAGYVQSIIVFPIWNPAMYEQIGYKTMTDFYYGSEKLPLGGSYNVVLKGDTIAPMKIATIYVSPKFNNFLDYDPYTTYEIWLPFHGWAKLPSEQVVGHYLNVYYVINTSSTKGTIIIRQETDSAVILEVDCTIGVEIPISTTNGENVKRRQTSDAINLAVQGVGGVLMGAAGVLTGNPLIALGGAAMAAGAITGGISSSMTNRVEAQGKISDGNAGLYSDRVVKIRRTSSRVAVDDITKYAKYIGRPLQTNVKLNTLTGYTIVGGVHVENLGTATDNEKTDIENQLRKGVII